MSPEDALPDVLSDVLPDALLERIRGRAAGYDRDNAFFHEDLAELAAAGYLKIFVPASDGGLGLGLAAAAQLQRRLATAAPATALADQHASRLDRRRARPGRPGRLVARLRPPGGRRRVRSSRSATRRRATTRCSSTPSRRPSRRPAAATAFTGRKIFTSLSPAWTRLGIFGKDPSAADGAGQLVHGFLTRETPGYEILADWDTLGMRASQSNTTVLDGAVVPAERIFRKLPVGPNADPLIFAIFACFETLLAAVYTGIGERALVLGVEAVKRRTSFKNGGRSYAQDPDIRWKVADAAMAMDALYPQLSSVAADVDALAEHGSQWFPKLVGLKVSATETARTVVDLAIRVSGGSSYFRGSELERLYRDVLAGMFHPSDDESAHNTVANAWLGPLESP